MREVPDLPRREDVPPQEVEHYEISVSRPVPREVLTDLGDIGIQEHTLTTVLKVRVRDEAALRDLLLRLVALEVEVLAVRGGARTGGSSD